MKPFTESLRYEYPDLNKDSLVIDAGAHVGEFARTIHTKYGCRVMCFEPVKRFYDELKKNTEGLHIMILPIGIGATTRTESFSIKGVMSGPYADNPERETVDLIAVADIVNSAEEIALMKLNVEGGEYEVMEAILDSGMAPRVKNFQIQFHSVIPDCRERRDRIRERLTTTHQLTYDEPWVWENWERK